MLSNFFQMPGISTTTFYKPFLERKAPAPGPSFKNVNQCSDETRELYFTSSNTAALAMIQGNRHLTMMVGQVIKKDPAGQLNSVLFNGSNTELAPAMTGPDSAHHYFGVMPRRGIENVLSVPDGMCTGTILTADQVEGSGFSETNLVAFAATRMFPCKYGAQWVEGSIDEPGVIDLFANEYGVDAGDWIRLVKHSMDNAAKIAPIYHKLKQADKFEEHLGSKYENITLAPGGPDVQIYAINRESAEDDYKLVRTNCGPYKTIAAAAPPPAVGGGGGPTTLADVATILQTKGDRVESEKMKRGLIKLRGANMAAEVDFKKGFMKDPSLPTPTAACKAMLALKTIDERAYELKSILDTNSSLRPKGVQVTAMYGKRTMRDHDEELCRKLVVGALATVPLKTLGDKTMKVGIAAYLPMGSTKLDKMKEERDRKTAQEAHGSADDESRIELFLPDHVQGQGQVMSMLANHKAANDAMWISIDQNDTPVVAQASDFLFHLFLEPHMADWTAALSAQESDDLNHHIIARLDRLHCAFSKQADDYTVKAAVGNDAPQSIELAPYNRYLTVFADDIRDMEKAANGGARFRPSISIKPVPKVQEPQFKKQRQEAQAPRQHQQQQRAPSQASPNGANQQGASGWGNAWSNPGAQAPRPRDSAESKKKGDLCLRGNLEPAKAMAPSLANIHCAPFATKGFFCEGCPLKHLPMHKWADEDRATQIAHVEANVASVKFRKGLRWLPNGKEHLVHDGEN